MHEQVQGLFHQVEGAHLVHQEVEGGHQVPQEVEGAHQVPQEVEGVHEVLQEALEEQVHQEGEVGHLLLHALSEEVVAESLHTLREEEETDLHLEIQQEVEGTEFLLALQ